METIQQVRRITYITCDEPYQYNTQNAYSYEPQIIRTQRKEPVIQEVQYRTLPTRVIRREEPAIQQVQYQTLQTKVIRKEKPVIQEIQYKAAPKRLVKKEEPLCIEEIHHQTLPTKKQLCKIVLCSSKENAEDYKTTTVENKTQENSSTVNQYYVKNLPEERINYSTFVPKGLQRSATEPTIIRKTTRTPEYVTLAQEPRIINEVKYDEFPQTENTVIRRSLRTQKYPEFFSATQQPRVIEQVKYEELPPRVVSVIKTRNVNTQNYQSQTTQDYKEAFVEEEEDNQLRNSQEINPMKTSKSYVTANKVFPRDNYSYRESFGYSGKKNMNPQ